MVNSSWEQQNMDHRASTLQREALMGIPSGSWASAETAHKAELNHVLMRLVGDDLETSHSPPLTSPIMAISHSQSPAFP